MHLGTDHQQQLRSVTQARKRFEQAERAGRRTALEAIAAGVPQSRVADALGVSRMTLWRWTHEASQ